MPSSRTESQGGVAVVVGLQWSLASMGTGRTLIDHHITWLQVKLIHHTGMVTYLKGPGLWLVLVYDDDGGGGRREADARTSEEGKHSVIDQTN